MFTTGPMFVTVQYALYPAKSDITVLPPLVYGKYQKTEAAYFKHLHGSSWHGKDAKMVFWLEEYGLIGGAVLVLIVLTLWGLRSVWCQRVPPGQVWYHALVTGAPRTGLVGVGTLPISTKRVQHMGTL